MARKWFKPKGHTGWKKTQKASYRRKLVLLSTDKRKTLRSRYVEAGRKMLALANVTQDPETKKKALSDAKYFFNRVKMSKS